MATSTIQDRSASLTFNARSKDATAIDAKTGEVAGTVSLGGKPEAGQADGAGHVWVNIEDKAQLTEFDSKELKVINTWPLPNCEEPTGMAIDLVHKRLFIGCHSQQMLVVDYEGKVVASVPIGQGVDADGFDPAPAWHLHPVATEPSRCHTRTRQTNTRWCRRFQHSVAHGRWPWTPQTITSTQ